MPDFIYQGLKFQSLAQIRGFVITTEDASLARGFAEALRDAYGPTHAGTLIMEFAGYTGSCERMARTLERFTGINCSNDFFVAEVPPEGAIDGHVAIMKVRLVDGASPTFPDLLVVEKAAHAPPALSPRARRFLPLRNGPVRLVPMREWPSVVTAS